MRILVTGAGGAAAISVWKSLAGIHQLHMTDCDPFASGLYLVPKEQRMLLPRGDAAEFIDSIFEICKKWKINLLISTVDTELLPLANASQRFLEAGIKLPLCSHEVLKICHDKYLLLNHCKDIVSIPDTLLLTADSILSNVCFPLFAKPRIGAGSTGVRLIKNSKELDSLPTDGSYLLQEYLPGDEYSVDVYIHSSTRPIAAVPRLRMKIDSGVALTARTVYLPELIKLALKVAVSVGIRYVANIQFKCARNGEFKLLEINPRFPGTLPLTAAAGIDIPKILIDDIQSKSCPETILPFKEIMVVRYWFEHFCSLSEMEEICQS